MDQKIIHSVEEIAREACRINNVAMYGFELKMATKGMIVLIYITKIGGVSVEDCKQVSRYVERVLEEEDIIKKRYYLEVSSPGLERDLKLKMHYVSAIGEIVKIVYQKDDTSDVIKGKLLEVLPDEIVLEIPDDKFVIRFSEIKKAKTYFDYKKSD
ncbi:ribosome maturation factor RimP [Candidatus Cloacimonadota bacterium]